jgi:hypothetical protein
MILYVWIVEVSTEATKGKEGLRRTRECMGRTVAAEAQQTRQKALKAFNFVFFLFELNDLKCLM